MSLERVRRRDAIIGFVGMIIIITALAYGTYLYGTQNGMQVVGNVTVTVTRNLTQTTTIISNNTVWKTVTVGDSDLAARAKVMYRLLRVEPCVEPGWGCLIWVWGRVANITGHTAAYDAAEALRVLKGESEKPEPDGSVLQSEWIRFYASAAEFNRWADEELRTVLLEASVRLGG